MNTQNEALPSNLKSLLESEEFEENGGLLITSLNYSNDDLKIIFTLSFGDNGMSEQMWQLDVIGIEKEYFVRNWATSLKIFSDHFLLYEFIDNYTELYFKGSTSNPEKLLVDLYASHVTNYSKNLEFGMGINAPNGMLQLCTNNYGLFARGSKRILQKFAECLHANGINTYFINEIQSNKKELKLLVFGESYFIAKDFKFYLVK